METGWRSRRRAPAVGAQAHRPQAALEARSLRRAAQLERPRRAIWRAGVDRASVVRRDLARPSVSPVRTAPGLARFGRLAAVGGGRAARGSGRAPARGARLRRRATRSGRRTRRRGRGDARRRARGRGRLGRDRRAVGPAGGRGRGRAGRRQRTDRDQAGEGGQGSSGVHRAIVSKPGRARLPTMRRCAPTGSISALVPGLASATGRLGMTGIAGAADLTRADGIDRLVLFVEDHELAYAGVSNIDADPRRRRHRTRPPPDPRHGHPARSARLRPAPRRDARRGHGRARRSSSRVSVASGGPGRPSRACSRTPASPPTRPSS